MTCYAALTVQQLLEAFVTGPLVGTPHGATLYFVPEGSKIEFSKGMLYTGAVGALAYMYSLQCSQSRGVGGNPGSGPGWYP